MKKAILAALILGLSFSIFQNSWAATRTSTSLTTTSNLINDIAQAEVQTVPIGTVIAWPHSSLPENGDWMECNGATVNAANTEYRSKFGATVPDYRGIFLRGYGSKNLYGRTIASAGLGQTQSDGIRIEEKDIRIKSGDMFMYRWYQSFTGHGADDDYTAAFGNYIRKGSPVTGIEIGNLKSNEDTTRPVNVAVKYIIKVR